MKIVAMLLGLVLAGSLARALPEQDSVSVLSGLYSSAPRELTEAEHHAIELILRDGSDEYRELGILVIAKHSLAAEFSSELQDLAINSPSRKVKGTALRALTDSDLESSKFLDAVGANLHDGALSSALYAVREREIREFEDELGELMLESDSVDVRNDVFQTLQASKMLSVISVELWERILHEVEAVEEVQKRALSRGPDQTNMLPSSRLAKSIDGLLIRFPEVEAEEIDYWRQVEAKSNPVEELEKVDASNGGNLGQLGSVGLASEVPSGRESQSLERNRLWRPSVMGFVGALILLALGGYVWFKKHSS